MKKKLNIFLGVLLVITVALMAYAVMAPHSDDPSQYDAAISLNLFWGYGLLGLGVLSALGCAAFGMIQNPSSTKLAAVAFVLIVAVVGVAYFVSASHHVQIADLSTGGHFGSRETVIAETCVYVTYVAFAAAFLTALVTEVWRAFK